MTQKILPAVPLRGITVMPGTVIHFDLNRGKSIAAVEQAMMSGGEVFLVTQKDIEENEPSFEGLAGVGTIAVVKQITKLPNHVIRILVEGVGRGVFLEICEENQGFLEACVREVLPQEEAQGLPSGEEGYATTQAMLRQLKEYFSSFASYYPKLGSNAMKRYADIEDPGSLIDQIAMNMPLDNTYKQKVLEAVPGLGRDDVFCGVFVNEIEGARI